VYPYFIILIVVIVLALLAEKAKGNRFIHNFYVVLIFLVLVLFAGLRDLTVGTDTNMYASRFENLSFDFFSIMNQKTRIELGYRLIEYIGLIFSNNYVAILLTTAFVAVYFQLKSIYKLSEKPVISIFIFITFGIYTYMFNGARQALAAAVYMYALTFLVNANFRKYVFWVLIASLFHKSVIFGLPLYFFFRKKFSLRWRIVLAISVLIAINFFNIFMEYVGLISEQYSKYDNIDNQGGVYLTLTYTLLSVFFILMRGKIKHVYKRNYDIYLNMFLFGTAVFITVVFTGAYVEITRIAFYFTLSAIFIWPLIFKNLKQNEIALPLVLFLAAHLTFFYIFIGKMSNLTPYIFNSQIFN